MGNLYEYVDDDWSRTNVTQEFWDNWQDYDYSSSDTRGYDSVYGSDDYERDITRYRESVERSREESREREYEHDWDNDDFDYDWDDWDSNDTDWDSDW